MQHVGRLGVLPRRARRRLRPQVRAAVGLDRGGVQLRLIPGQSGFPQSIKIPQNTRMAYETLAYLRK